MFGKATETPQKETTPFYPRSPYGAAKLFGHWLTVNYRESYNMFACSGILFNHESPLRGEKFVTKKITTALSKIKLGLLDCLKLGNIDSKRDWGFAGDYVEAIHMILQQKKPNDFVISTGKTHTVRKFVETAAKLLGMKIQWQGRKFKERGIDKKTGKTIIKIDRRFFRPAEVDVLHGDYSKAKKILKWKPKTSFNDLVEMMIISDYNEQKKIIK
jgi:GDPmannose 4,6-dehydratase